MSPLTLPNGHISQAYSQTISATGGTGADTFSVPVGALPTGLSLDPMTGAITGTLTVDGTFNFTIAATDTTGAAGNHAYTVIISPVVVGPATLADWTAGKSGYSQTVVATNGTGPYTYAVTTGILPTGLTLNPNSGLVSGTPTSANSFAFTITATDSIGATGNQSYTVVINSAIGVSPSTLANWTVNQGGYSQTISVSGGTGIDTFSVSAGTLPNGLSLDPSTGVLSGTPTLASTFNFTVTATDSVGAKGSRPYTVVVNQAIVVSPAPLANWTQNLVGYNQTVTATGGTGAITFSVSVGLLPTGLALNPGTGAITGTPAVSGTFPFTITATDSINATGSRPYTVTVAPPVVVGPGTLANWTINQPNYIQNLTTTGGTGGKAFTVTAGAPPTGLGLSASGILSGTPTVAGNFTFTVTATDLKGATGTHQYTVTINPAITVNPTSLVSWTVNQPGYSQLLTTTGGTGAKSFGVTAGALPTGLSLDPSTGLLAGRPAVTGTFTFTVTATESSLIQTGAKGSRAYTITINRAVAISTTTLPNAQVGQAYSQMILAQGSGTGAKTFRVTAGALPAALSLNGTTGVISGVPTVGTAAQFTITATDTIGATAARAYTIAITQLVISQSRSGPVFPNGLVTYTITVRNVGSAAATGVQIFDSLPAFTTFQSARLNNAPIGSTISNGLATFNVGTIAAGGTVTLTVTVAVSANPTIGATVRNIATVRDAMGGGLNLASVTDVATVDPTDGRLS